MNEMRVAEREEIFEVTKGIMVGGRCVLELRRVVDGEKMFSMGASFEEALTSKEQTKSEVIEALRLKGVSRERSEAVWI